MKRVLEAELETICKKDETALNRFFKKYPELIYWRESFEYMIDNNICYEANETMADGTRNHNWTYALHFLRDEDHYYICVIERA